MTKYLVQIQALFTYTHIFYWKKHDLKRWTRKRRVVYRVQSFKPWKGENFHQVLHMRIRNLIISMFRIRYSHFHQASNFHNANNNKIVCFSTRILSEPGSGRWNPSLCWERSRILSSDIDSSTSFPVQSWNIFKRAIFSEKVENCRNALEIILSRKS